MDSATEALSMLDELMGSTVEAQSVPKAPEQVLRVPGATQDPDNLSPRVKELQQRIKEYGPSLTL